MEASTDMRVARLAALRLASVGAISGLIAGVILALTQLVYGWASSVHTAWDAPMAIWAWFAGMNYFGQPSNHVWPIVLGYGVLMVSSIVAGLIFAALLSAVQLRNDLWAVVLGVGYALVLWAIVRYGILPLRDSTKTLFTTSTVSPQWVWWLANGLFGLTLGIVYVAVRRAWSRPMAHVSRLGRREQRVAA
jgi:hypothetical protein